MAGLKYWVWLCTLQGLGNQAKLRLLDHFGAPENIYYADEEEYLLVQDLPREQAALLRDKSCARADEVLGECSRLGLRLLTLQDASYPARLRNIYDPPVLVYVRGNLPDLDEEVPIAMVGTRGATPYGTAAAEKLAYQLTQHGALVVSGMAQGIDTYSLKGALRSGGSVISVIAGGHDIAYPAENRYLYEDVAAAGVLLSEYPPGTRHLASHFPVRNRIISGLSVATLVVEAPEESGALITANTALEQSRDVYAVPGPIDAPQSRGCNRLIADGAVLVCDAWDILQAYQPQYPHKLHPAPQSVPRSLGYQQRQEKAAARKLAAEEDVKEERAQLDLREGAQHGLTDDQIAILKAMGEQSIHVDDLIEQTGIPTRRALSALTMLEIENYVLQQSGKFFLRTVELLV